MVDAKEFCKVIQEILPQEYKVEFLGNNFEKITSLLTETKAQKIYNWMREVIQRKIQPIIIGSAKHYKDWRINELLTFRYAFNINNTEYRILLVKVKNSIYIEFHLGDHNYYDKVRKDLDLKKGNY